MENLNVGLQLYSIRQAMTENMDEALGRVKAMGYDYVEFSGGRYGKTAAETRQLLEKHGLTCISVHQSPTFFENDPRDAVDYVKTLGAEFSVIPICRLSVYLEDWEKQLRLYRQMTQAFQSAGIRLLYHNHDHELTVLPGDRIPLLDRIFLEVPGLEPEFDTCWLSYGGADPASYIIKYAPRLDIIHLKDYRCDLLPPRPMWQLLAQGQEKPEKRSAVGFQYVPVGYGVENFENILTAARASKARYVVVEQDESRTRDPLEAAALSRKYLKEQFSI